ncbi:MAG: tetratricopeptide repeat protein [Myxococcales bacterium]|jgi:hypothetical protein
MTDGRGREKPPARVRIYYFEKKPKPAPTIEELETRPGIDITLPGPEADPFAAFGPGELPESAAPTIRTSALPEKRSSQRPARNRAGRDRRTTPPSRPSAKRRSATARHPPPPTDFEPLATPRETPPAGAARAARDHKPDPVAAGRPTPQDGSSSCEEALEYHRRRLQGLSARPQRDSSLADRALFGHALFASGRVREAQLVFENIVACEPEEAFAYTMLGAIYLAQGDDARALALYEAALALDPRDLAALVGRSEIRLRRGQPDAALGDLERAIAADPSGRDPFSQRARALMVLAKTLFRTLRS